MVNSVCLQESLTEFLDNIPSLIQLLDNIYLVDKLSLFFISNNFDKITKDLNLSLSSF